MMNQSIWEADLSANSDRRGLSGALLAWITTPGFAIATYWRLAKFLSAKGGAGRLIGWLLWRNFIASRGCFISLKANIGPGLALPHPVGIVVGEGVRLGSNVTLYQNVTLGGRSTTNPDYPQVGDGVTLYAGSVALGGICLGAGCVIAANAVVRIDVPPGATAVGIPARILATNAP